MDRITINREIVLNGRWYLDAENNQLIDLQGRSAAATLSPRAVRLLMLFAETPNTVIGRRKLFDEGWRQFGFEVCDNSLNQVICSLREAFRGFGADAPGIKTVPRIGYCLTARVTTREASAEAVTTRPATGVMPERRLVDRQAFDDIVRQEWGRAQRGDRPLSLLMVRCAVSIGASPDGADASGLSGRAILGQIHRAGDVAARYASDGAITVYAVLLPATDEGGAAIVARRIRTAAHVKILAVALASTVGQQHATPEGFIETACSELRGMPGGMPDSPAAPGPMLSLAA
jgi:DNA-binding winged helix-turn-helix (wHTH) protein